MKTAHQDMPTHTNGNSITDRVVIRAADTAKVLLPTEFSAPPSADSLPSQNRRTGVREQPGRALLATVRSRG